jgi:erythromycin esterase
MLLNKVVGLRTAALVLAAVAVSGAAACSHPVTPPALPPAPLDDSGAAAVRWVDQHAVPLTPTDSGPVTVDRAALRALVGDARVLGVSELAEGTREFPRLVRTIVTVLAEDAGLRGIMIQAPGMEALEIDRYVRGGPGDAPRLLRMLGAAHWQTRDMAEFVDWLRQFNRGRSGAEQVGFYGFEIPNALHAIQVVNALADTT